MARRHPIASARQQKGIDRRQLATAIGSTEAEVLGWEEGSAHPAPVLAVRMARVLRLSLAEIYISLIEAEQRAGRIPPAEYIPRHVVVDTLRRAALERLATTAIEAANPAREACH